MRIIGFYFHFYSGFSFYFCLHLYFKIFFNKECNESMIHINVRINSNCFNHKINFKMLVLCALTQVIYYYKFYAEEKLYFTEIPFKNKFCTEKSTQINLNLQLITNKKKWH